MRYTYELLPAGARSGRTIPGWRRATHTALTEAIRRHAPVAVWQCESDGLRTLRVTVWPDGRWVRHLAQHRRPKGLGLPQEKR